jgi:hypothetical protein
MTEYEYRLRHQHCVGLVEQIASLRRNPSIDVWYSDDGWHYRHQGSNKHKDIVIECSHPEDPGCTYTPGFDMEATLELVRKRPGRPKSTKMDEELDNL